MSSGQTLTVSELNGYLKNLLSKDPSLQDVCVVGEISNFKSHSAGHLYFSLKDSGGSIRCVMFAREAIRLKFQPSNGMKVILSGKVSVFPRDGTYQLYCTDITPDGVGSLYLAFEQLKSSLSKEGLFDPEHKLQLPSYPRRIALITSPTGAAVQDMLRILAKRWPYARVYIIPVLVQGDEAPLDICSAIDHCCRYRVAEVAIVGRGGGSIEDLWAFNDERVARAIFAATIPIVSAVGHEPDFTIADFVADVRAATPSQAAELVTPDIMEVEYLLGYYSNRAATAVVGRISFWRQRLDALARNRMLQDPACYVQARRLSLHLLHQKLSHNMARLLAARREKFSRSAAKLEALSPLAVLARGYGIISSDEHGILKTAQQTAPGDRVTVTLEDGSLLCEVIETNCKVLPKEKTDG